MGIRTTERFSRNLSEIAKRDDFQGLLTSIADPLNATARQDAMQEERSVPQDPMAQVIRSLHRATENIRDAFATLTTEEQAELRTLLYQQTTGGVEKAYTFPDNDLATRVADLLEKIDRRELIAAARALVPLTDEYFLEQLADAIRAEPPETFSGVEGRIVNRIETPDGDIIVGGADSNTYELDQMQNVSVLIDLGGDDHYVEGSLSEKRPVLIVLDLSGDDTYTGHAAGIQGGAIIGASLLVDQRGNDSYESADVAQGSTLAGVGILVDESGNDTYRGVRRVQGQAIAGVGILIDEKGDDHYRAALLSQGTGGPLGFGLVVDDEGSDTYYAGGKYADSYADSPGFGAWSQGIGAGAEGIANGGIGVMLDGSGNDEYQADYFSHGGGYWFGAGIARDFAGDDRRIGATTENFDGSPRMEERFLRWGIGFGCHYSAGYVFDDDGNDLYEGNWASIAYAWDFSVASLCDFRGNDRYVSSGSGVAEAFNRAIAILYDVSGDDSYESKEPGYAEEQRKEAVGPKESSFTLLYDSEGEDTYSGELRNHSNIARGWKGGMFIDR